MNLPVNLSDIGRFFYGMAIAGMGIQTIYDKDLPYMLMPPNHSGIPGFIILVYLSGALLIAAGLCILFKKNTRSVALLLGGALLMIFCFYYIPYEFFATSDYMHFLEWDNALKELALSAGAFVIAGCFSGKTENTLIRFLTRLYPFGANLFALTMASFGTLHFLYAKGVSGYMPSWIPYPVFWIYFAGSALFGSGIAIIFKIKLRLIAALLGTMIFTWFIILHIPKVIAAPAADEREGELTSAFLALAYSGIAFVIAGTAKNNSSV